MVEKQLSEKTSPDKKYSFQVRGNNEVKLYSKEYVVAYEKELKGMVERRMKSSVKMTADFWFTCWVEAGQPDLSQLTLIKSEGNVLEKNGDGASKRARLHVP